MERNPAATVEFATSVIFAEVLRQYAVDVPTICPGRRPSDSRPLPSDISPHVTTRLIRSDHPDPTTNETATAVTPV